MKIRAGTFSRVIIFILIGCFGLMVGVAVDGAHAQSVVGIWQCRTLAPTPWGMCQGTTILKSDGSFSRSNQCGALRAGDQGKYKVGDGYVHYDIEDCWPKEYNGKPMNCLKSETFYFQWVNANQVKGQNVECFR